VTNIGIDRGLLSSMAEKARSEIEGDTVEVLADRGYFKSEEIAACEEAGIKAYVPRPLTSNARAQGRFDRRDFVYDQERDAYVCPVGEQLIYRMATQENGKVMRRYWTNVCEACALKQQCTTGKERRIARWENEAVLERVQERLDQKPTHFAMKTLKHVATEMALHVLAYNIKRVIAIIGIPELLRAIEALIPSLSAVIALHIAYWRSDSTIVTP